MLMGFIINTKFMEKHSNYQVEFMVLSLITYIVSFIFSGLIFGFGLNILILSPLTLILEITLLASSILFIESTRTLLVKNRVVDTNPLIELIIATIVSTTLYIYVFGEPPTGINWFIKYLALLSYNALLSIIAWIYDLRTLIIHLVAFTGLYKVSPILPLNTNLMSYIFPLIIQSIFIAVVLYIVAKPFNLDNVVIYRVVNPSKYSKIISTASLAISVGFLISFLCGIRFLAITSGSMTPEINIGDVVVSTPVSISDVKVGDIIVFKGDSNLVVHRVVGFSRDNCFITKGDANENNDPLWACGDNVVGRVFLTIPLVGYPAVLLLETTGSFINMISLVLSLLSLIYVYYIAKEVVLY
jgi:signal peptidase